MRIGIIGTKWGLTHIGTFRENGHEIAALMGQDEAKTREIALREGIPVATTDSAALDAMDAVVIATPASTHLGYIERFRGKPVLCEKPLTGAAIEPASLDALADLPVYVNYAFPFLQTARDISRLVTEGRLGEVFRIIINISPYFEIRHTPLGWFMDDAVHPLSWLNHLFAPFRLVSHTSSGERPDISTVMSNGRQTLNLNLYQAHTVQLQFDVTVAGTKGVVRTSGGFMPGRFWNFEPVTLNGEAQNGGEYSANGRDIWYEANREAVRVFLAVAEGRIVRQEALRQGLCDIRKAAEIETGLEGMLRQL